MKTPHSFLTAFCTASTTRCVLHSSVDSTSSTRCFSVLPLSLVPSNFPLSASIDQPLDVIATTNMPPGVVFEPTLPSTTTLIGMSIIIILCAVVAWVWQTQVVPTSRTNLAISKARGPVKLYLDELREAVPTRIEDDIDDSRYLPRNRSAYDLNTDDVMDDANTPPTTRLPSRMFERWLFMDWLRDNKLARKAGRQKEPALPILKDAKWNSGDNPVLAATLLIGIGVLVSAVTERVATSTI